jgi:hypothetical protein
MPEFAPGTRLRSVAAALLAGLAIAAMAVAGPATVSPGSVDGLALAPSACPTFSWAAVPGATGYELTVVRTDGEQGVREEVVLEVTLPAGARTWAPDADHCLAPAGSFAWSLRAFGPERWSPWSTPRFFEVRATARAEEMGLAEALEVLRRHLAALGEGSALPLIPAADAIPRSLAPHGPIPTFAVRVVVDGIAVVAANLDLEGGADLVLDGSAQAAADARLSESGVDRPASTPQTFEIRNSGDGGMTLTVDGIDVVTTATDRDTLRDLDCSGGQIARYDAGAGAWVCRQPPP